MKLTPIPVGFPVMGSRHEDGRNFLWTEPMAVRSVDGRWLFGAAAHSIAPTTGDDMKDNWSILPDDEAESVLAEAEAAATP